MTKAESNTKEPTISGSSLVPPKKKLRSQPPDVIVVVGQGDNRVEFECYKYALCCKSEYFDSMFSLPMRENEMSRIELPGKDPEEWKLFYECIDPATANSAKVTDENAMTLAPWFHEYQMNELLAKCDDIIHDKIIKDDNDVKADVLETLLNNLEFCERYSLERSFEKAINELSVVVMNSNRFWIENLKLLKRVFDIYKDHKKVMDELLCPNKRGLFLEIEYFSQRAYGEDIWRNRYFRRLIETKLESIHLWSRFVYSDSYYRDIKGTVEVKGAGLDVVNGIYIRHNKKFDSVAVFTKSGYFKNTSCKFQLYRCLSSKKWYIQIAPNERQFPNTFTYCCDSSGAVNEIPHGYKWLTMPEGINPPPIVEYRGQTSSLSDDIST